MDRDATLCCARRVEWGNLITPVFCMLVNPDKKPAVIHQGQLIALIVAIKTHDPEIFDCLFSMGPLTSDRPSLCPPQTPLPSAGLDENLPNPDTVI